MHNDAWYHYITLAVPQWCFYMLCSVHTQYTHQLIKTIRLHADAFMLPRKQITDNAILGTTSPQIGHPYKLFYNSKVLKKWRALCRILGVIGLGGELRRKQTRKEDASLRLGMRQISQSASGHWLVPP